MATPLVLVLEVLILSEIEANISDIRRRIAEAARRGGREPGEVTLMAVTKTVPVERMTEAYRCGIREFGENKAQEIVAKYPAFGGQGVSWNMIGHLQTNKVKSVIDKAAMIHSVDSERLALEISKASGAAGIVSSVMIEINIAGEESKFGIAPAETVEFAGFVASLSCVKLAGLMCVAPEIARKPDENREYFENMRKIFIDIKEKRVDNGNMRHLSMGMTGDFETAVECGSTIVRVGSGIFGARDYAR